MKRTWYWLWWLAGAVALAGEHSGTVPDLICLGKALTGGFPLSACVGRADVMDAAWPAATGEAIHTSTFLGHPVGWAARDSSKPGRPPGERWVIHWHWNWSAANGSKRSRQRSCGQEKL